MGVNFTQVLRRCSGKEQNEYTRESLLDENSDGIQKMRGIIRRKQGGKTIKGTYVPKFSEKDTVEIYFHCYFNRKLA